MYIQFLLVWLAFSISKWSFQTRSKKAGRRRNTRRDSQRRQEGGKQAELRRQGRKDYLGVGTPASEGRALPSGTARVLVGVAEAPGPAGVLRMTVGAVSAPASSSERMVIAMRRLRARPSGVALSATGRNSP